MEISSDVHFLLSKLIVFHCNNKKQVSASIIHNQKIFICNNFIKICDYVPYALT